MLKSGKQKEWIVGKLNGKDCLFFRHKGKKTRIAWLWLSINGSDVFINVRPCQKTNTYLYRKEVR